MSAPPIRDDAHDPAEHGPSAEDEGYDQADQANAGDHRFAQAPAGHLAVPSTPGPWPGVVVLPEIFGLTDDIRAHTDRLAAAGYLALAPDVLSGGLTLRCVVRAMREVSAGRGPTFDAAEAARAYLAGREDCTGYVGVIGFCMGGGFALVAAARQDFDAAAVNYGVLPRHLDDALAGTCPVVASYGARDRTLRHAASKLERTLTAQRVDHDVKEYPDSGHGFMNDHPLPLIARIGGGAGFRGADAEDAWRRIEDFFARHLVR
jgi:carboxymethylenebutenolidase